MKDGYEAVEDEYLIAMDMVEMIEALGAEVVGPANRLQAARELARAEALDGGILEVRLGEAISCFRSQTISSREGFPSFSPGYRTWAHFLNSTKGCRSFESPTTTRC